MIDRRSSRHRLMLVGLILMAVAGACRKGGAPTSKAPAPAGAQPSAPVVAPVAADSARKPDSTVVPPATPPKDSAAKDSAAAAKPAPSAAAAPKDSAPTDPKAVTKAAPKKKPAPTTKNCLLDLSESPLETRLLYQRVSEGVSNTFVGGGFVGRCQGENTRLRADSAEQFEAAGIINLFGNVVYEDPGKMQVQAAHAIYFTREGRLFADGGVVATQVSSGSTFSGPSMEYYRATPERPVSRLVAPNRSIATLIEKDSVTGKPGPPTSVMANRFEDAGDSLLFAWGDVIITRQQLNGRADSSVFDKLTERSRLLRGARIVNNDTARRFTLVGDTIDLFSTNRQLDRVVAHHKSRATTGDMQLDAEQIDLRLKAQQLTEAFAFGTGRARATTPQQDLDADSLRIRMAEKVIREVHAIGGARAVGAVDSMKIRTPEKDQLRGDSIFAYFDSSAAAMKDTVKGPPLTEIRARGNASSLFHMANKKGRDGKPAINYVRGARIFVNFDTGAVRTVRVDSQAYGVFIEPEDSVVVDTAAARRDSLARNRGRGRGRNNQPAAKATPGGTSPAATPPAKPPVPTKPPVGPSPAAAVTIAPFLAVARRRRP